MTCQHNGAIEYAAQTTDTHRWIFFRCASKQSDIKLFAKDFTGCGWTVLALGKLGAGELNFSSDVDLIALHDTHNAPFYSHDAVQPFFVTMTRDLIRLLSTTTRDGIGWRVDLRFRPDPGATAVSIDLNAAITQNRLHEHGNVPLSSAPAPSR